MHPANRRRLALLLELLVVSTLIAPRAEAQLMVQMKLNKSSYVSYESMRAEVTVHNRAGHDIVLSGPKDRSWLTFNIYKDGQLLSPRPGGAGLGPFVLGTGKSITKSVDINRFYPVSDYGNYTISASVYFAPLKAYFSSAKQRFQVFDSKPFWKQSVGVSRGSGKLASFREFSLFEHRGRSSSNIYVRLRDVRGPRVYCTFSLGRYINVRKPQATIDSQNRLHVLHMTDPRLYAHSKISPDGRLLSRAYFKEGQRSRPSLAIDPGGVVQVIDGIPYDPDKPQPITAPARGASERPPGLPK